MILFICNKTIIMKSENNTTVNNNEDAKPTTTLHELVHRHINNENDVITEEELRNVIVGVENVAQPVADLKQDAEDKAKAVENADDKPATTWDVIE
jgi:hypothetical protein